MSLATNYILTTVVPQPLKVEQPRSMYGSCWHVASFRSQETGAQERLISFQNSMRENALQDRLSDVAVRVRILSTVSNRKLGRHWTQCKSHLPI